MKVSIFDADASETVTTNDWFVEAEPDVATSVTLCVPTSVEAGVPVNVAVPLPVDVKLSQAGFCEQEMLTDALGLLESVAVML